MERLKKFLKEEDGVTAIEYALIAVLIAVGIVASVQGVTTWINNTFATVAGLPGGGG